MDSLAELHLRISMNYFEEDACNTLTDEKETRFRLEHDEGTSTSVDGSNLVLEVSRIENGKKTPIHARFFSSGEEEILTIKNRIRCAERSA